ncbi:MAG TPA: hypothetical protein VN644_17555 [Pyrinomonadaceae bacterium]|nr:hypothetical protein [Pyrinomonadaceae bacterium]
MLRRFSRKGAKAQRRTSFALLRLCAQISLLFLIVAAVPSHAQKNSPRFDPDGSFWVSGTPPDDFLELSAINLNAKRMRRLPSPGLQVTDGTTYRFKTLTVKRNSFTFTTVSLKNISYTFYGRFLRGGVYAETELNDERPVMEGTLTKYRAGNKVAEARIQFYYFGGT